MYHPLWPRSPSPAQTCSCAGRPKQWMTVAAAVNWSQVSAMEVESSWRLSLLYESVGLGRPALPQHISPGNRCQRTGK